MGEPVLQRRGVLLTRDHMPVPPSGIGDVTSVFNPGAVHWEGADRLLLRVQSRSRETYIYSATRSARAHDLSGAPASVNPDAPGSWSIAPEPTRFSGLENHASGLRVYHVYDPRLTVIDGTLFAVLAVDTNEGCRLLTARSRDFTDWEIVGFDDSGDRRNGVLFPKRIGGDYARLERPNTVSVPGQARTGTEVVLATSPDLKHWSEVGPVFGGRPHYWDELVGPGTPPILTERGWLLLYHGVATHFAAANVYQVGAILLDRQDPTRVLGRTRENVLEPRQLYETVGQIPNVVFPSGWIWRDEGGVIDVFYGAADTCVASATTTVEKLLRSLEDPDALS